MRRIRILFVGLALVLLLPLALLLQKAFESVAAERTLRHRTVADRVIDEMERELTDLLRREEDRPYDHYRFFFVPEEGLDLQRSPLSVLPQETFILGYFQIDPGGLVNNPLWPDNEVAAAAFGWTEDPKIRETVDLVASVVHTVWQTSEPATGAAEPRMVSMESKTAAKRGPRPEEPSAAEEERADTAVLEVFQKLNRAATARQQRSSKVAPTQAPSAYSFSEAAENLLQAAVTPESGGAVAEEALESAIQQTLQIAATATIDVRLEPMVGRPASDEGLVLYRTVLMGRQIYRQGLLISIPELVRWLAERVLESAGLAGGITIRSGLVEPGDADFAYRHRFAEPFGSVVATLLLQPLPERRGARYLATLAGLLVLTAALGFFALYRMTAVVVSFAQRRSNFVSAVTHELKTPLTAIRMYSEMLRDGAVPEAKQARYYQIITAESERLSRLINNVLELSRLERRSREVHLVSDDVAPLLEQVVSLLTPHAERKGFELRLEIAPDLQPVRFDRDALLQVLFNLVDNAIKYARQGDRREVLLSCQQAPEGGTAIRVADRGPGVAPHHLRKIFEPFYRGESELTRSSQGSGIGLSLVRRLVEQMGGSVAGRNRPGGGFEVEIFLPG